MTIRIHPPEDQSAYENKLLALLVQANLSHLTSALAETAGASDAHDSEDAGSR